MNASKTKFWLIVRSIAYGVILLIGVAVALPSFVKSRWSSSGVPVTFQFMVVDSLTGLEEVERWVLSWGTHATVISPPALATRVRSIAATLVHRYPTSTDTTANP